MQVKKKVIRLPKEEGPSTLNNRFIPIQKKSTGSISGIGSGVNGGSLTQSCVFNNLSHNEFTADSNGAQLNEGVGFRSLTQIQVHTMLSPKIPSLTMNEPIRIRLSKAKSENAISEEVKKSLLLADSEDNLGDSKLKSIPASSKYRMFKDLEKQSTPPVQEDAPRPEEESQILIKVTKEQQSESLAEVGSRWK